jgi:peptidoglycan/LPS O-acetylase OafA/YrhL
VTASAVLEGGPAARTERTFPCLDGARALAATAVLVHHAAFWSGRYTPDLLGRVFARFDVGVPIFFVLSGFLLSRPLFRAAVEHRPAPRTAAYLWRRALRILPAYWLTVVAALLLLPQNDGAGPGTWLRQLTLTQIYGAGHLSEGLSHTWSLCTELAFYLVLPVLGGLLVRLARRSPDRPAQVLVALALMTALGLAWIVWIRSSDLLSAGAPDLWLPSFAGWFAAGMLLAVLSVADADWRPVRIASELGSSLATCWAAAGVLFWIATSPLAGPTSLEPPSAFQAVVKNVLYLGVAGLVILPLVFGNQRAGWVRPLLAGRVGRYLGEVSYGLFLVHVVVLAGGYAVLDLPQFTGHFPTVVVTTWLVSVTVASAIYWFVERPVRRWRTLVPERPGIHRDATTADTVITVSA